MTASPPDYPDVRQPDNPETIASDVDERWPWPPTQILWPWLGMNMLGFAVVTTILIQIAVVGQATGIVGGGIKALYFSGVVVGGLVGPMQAFILRNQVPRLRIWEWTLASIVGGYLAIFLWAIVLVALTLIMPVLQATIPILEAVIAEAQPSIYGVMLGVSVGLCQVIVLARHVRGLRRWWVANVIGRSLSWLSAQLLWILVATRVSTFPNRFWHFFIFALIGSVGGLIYGGVTARAIPRLTPRQRSIAASSDVGTHP